MKRLPAILFLLVLVFNFYGYRMMMAYMQTQSETTLEKQLDKNQYNDADLISIKTTLHLPYYTSSTEYERAYGSININGVVYQYVKQRVYHDTLELLCLPNNEKTNLLQTDNEITKQLMDGQASLPNKKSNTVVKLTLPDFFQQLKSFSVSNIEATKQNFHFFNIHFSTSNYSSPQEKPPQAMQLLS